MLRARSNYLSRKASCTTALKQQQITRTRFLLSAHQSHRRSATALQFNRHHYSTTPYKPSPNRIVKDEVTKEVPSAPNKQDVNINPTPPPLQDSHKENQQQEAIKTQEQQQQVIEQPLQPPPPKPPSQTSPPKPSPQATPTKPQTTPPKQDTVEKSNPVEKRIPVQPPSPHPKASPQTPPPKAPPQTTPPKQETVEKSNAVEKRISLEHIIADHPNTNGNGQKVEIDTNLLGKDQREVLDLALKGHSIFFTGSAGTGKSFLLRVLIQKLREQGKRIAVTASTGVAAEQIEGTTLHHYVGIGVPTTTNDFLKISKRSKLKSRWKNLDVLIIDEVSLISAEFFDLLEEAVSAIRKKPRFGGVQLILSGDFLQLPPIFDRIPSQTLVKQEEQKLGIKRFFNTKFCFEGKGWTKCQLVLKTLNQVFRQNEAKFVKVLNEIRVGKVSKESINILNSCNKNLKPIQGIEPTRLFPLNRDVNAINSYKLWRLPGNSSEFCNCSDDQYLGAKITFDAVDKVEVSEAIQGKHQLEARRQLLGNPFFWAGQAQKTLELKIGAQVIVIKNLEQSKSGSGDGIFNGSRGVVISWKNNKQALDELSKSKNSNDVRKKIWLERAKVSQQLWPVVRFVNGVEKTILPDVFVSEVSGVGTCKRWQLPLKLSWALTIHKCQGMSLDRAEICLENVFECGHAYVALSRVKSLGGLVLRGGFPVNCVKVNEKVLQFYGELPSMSTSNPTVASATITKSEERRLKSIKQLEAAVSEDVVNTKKSKRASKKVEESDDDEVDTPKSKKKQKKDKDESESKKKKAKTKEAEEPKKKKGKSKEKEEETTAKKKGTKSKDSKSKDTKSKKESKSTKESKSKKDSKSKETKSKKETSSSKKASKTSKTEETTTKKKNKRESKEEEDDTEEVKTKTKKVKSSERPKRDVEQEESTSDSKSSKRSKELSKKRLDSTMDEEDKIEFTYKPVSMPFVPPPMFSTGINNKIGSSSVTASVHKQFKSAALSSIEAKKRLNEDTQHQQKQTVKSKSVGFVELSSSQVAKPSSNTTRKPSEYVPPPPPTNSSTMSGKRVAQMYVPPPIVDGEKSKRKPRLYSFIDTPRRPENEDSS